MWLEVKPVKWQALWNGKIVIEQLMDRRPVLLREIDRSVEPNRTGNELQEYNLGEPAIKFNSTRDRHEEYKGKYPWEFRKVD